MTNIISPESLLEFYQENLAELAEKYLLIAEDTESGIQIYMTEEKGLPYFMVEVDGKQEYEDTPTELHNAPKVYSSILNLYIDQERHGDEFFSDEDMERIDEIAGAVEDLLCVLFETSAKDVGMSEVEFDEIADVVEQYLYENYGISVRHPTIMTSDDGESDVVVQYPYGQE